MAAADEPGTDLIGFVGVGRMGGAMAERLLAAGRRLIVHDPDAGAVRHFTTRGAASAASASEVADRAPLVFACLPTVEASLETAFGHRGVIHGQAVRCYVETSTIGRTAVEQIAHRLSEHGVDTLDAPVSGGPRAAASGTLNMIVAGSPRAMSLARSHLEAIAGHVFAVGETPGLGQTCKLVNNALSLTGLALACEAIAVGVKAGLEMSVLLDVINASSGRSGATLDKFPAAIAPRTFDYGGPLGAAAKDLNLFLAEAAEVGAAAPLSGLGASLWEIARHEGDPNRDYTTLYQLFERWAGLQDELSRPVDVQ